MPAPALVLDALARLDRDARTGEMGDPALQDSRKGGRALASRRDVEDEAVELVAHEVERGILAIEDVHLHRRKVLPQELSHGAESAGGNVNEVANLIGAEAGQVLH